MFRYSSAQDSSSPESSDSGIQTGHNSTSHIDSLLPHSMTSSCYHSNGVSNNNADEDDDDVDNDSNNNNHNNSQSAAEVKSQCQGQGPDAHLQGQPEGQTPCDCRSQPTEAPTNTVTRQVQAARIDFPIRSNRWTFWDQCFIPVIFEQLARCHGIDPDWSKQRQWACRKRRNV